MATHRSHPSAYVLLKLIAYLVKVTQLDKIPDDYIRFSLDGQKYACPNTPMNEHFVGRIQNMQE